MPLDAILFAVRSGLIEFVHVPRRLWARAAFFEWKVARQISSGSGGAVLGAGSVEQMRGRPPRSFIDIELGYGADQRPCSDDQKPCTLDYTLQNLDEINQRNRITYAQREGEGVETEASRDRQRMSAAKARKNLRQQLRRAGGAASGAIVSARRWTPMLNPNSGTHRRAARAVVELLRELGRVQERARALGDQQAA